MHAERVHARPVAIVQPSTLERAYFKKQGRVIGMGSIFARSERETRLIENKLIKTRLETQCRFDFCSVTYKQGMCPVP